MIRYVCPYLHELDEAIAHAERVADASSYLPDKQAWWERYRHQLIQKMTRHQLREFAKEWRR